MNTRERPERWYRKSHIGCRRNSLRDWDRNPLSPPNYVLDYGRPSRAYHETAKQSCRPLQCLALRIRPKSANPRWYALSLLVVHRQSHTSGMDGCKQHYVVGISGAGKTGRERVGRSRIYTNCLSARRGKRRAADGSIGGNERMYTIAPGGQFLAKTGKISRKS